MRVRSLGKVITALVVLACSAGVASAQQSREGATHEAGERALQEIQVALASGDARGLIRRSADRVDITVFGASEVLSRSQSMYVMKDFFRDYRPARISLEETSGSDGNWFASARYWAENEDTPFAVYVRMRLNERRWELRELRIGRSNSR